MLVKILYFADKSGTMVANIWLKHSVTECINICYGKTDVHMDRVAIAYTVLYIALHSENYRVLIVYLQFTAFVPVEN